MVEFCTLCWNKDFFANSTLYWSCKTLHKCSKIESKAFSTIKSTTLSLIIFCNLPTMVTRLRSPDAIPIRMAWIVVYGTASGSSSNGASEDVVTDVDSKCEQLPVIHVKLAMIVGISSCI